VVIQRGFLSISPQLKHRVVIFARGGSTVEPSLDEAKGGLAQRLIHWINQRLHYVIFIGVVI